jgi:hypothetical protein
MVGTTCIQDKEPAKIRAARAPIPGREKFKQKQAVRYGGMMFHPI